MYMLRILLICILHIKDGLTNEDVVRLDKFKILNDIISAFLPKKANEDTDGLVETGRILEGGIFNTSLAFTIPLFSFTLPDRIPDRMDENKDHQIQWALAIIGLVLLSKIFFLICPFLIELF